MTEENNTVEVVKETPSTYTHVGAALTALIGLLQILMLTPTPWTIGASCFLVLVAAVAWDRSSKRAQQITIAKIQAASKNSDSKIVETK